MLEDRLGIFAAHQNIYLRDKTDNSLHNLSQSEFEWDAQEGEFLNRFEILFRQPASDTIESISNLLKITKIGESVRITSSEEPIEKVKIFTIAGNAVYEKDNIGSKEFNLSLHSFRKGILMVYVELKSGEIQSKKIIHN